MAKDSPFRSRGLIVAAVAGVLVLLVGALAWSALRPAPETTVPRVTGQTKAAAEKALDERNLDIDLQSAYSDTVERGLVARQDPRPGATRREGDVVTVTISRGPQPVRLPEGLSGKRVDEVTRTLEGLGLKVRQVGQVSEAPFGTVLSVAPTSDLVKGDTVTVTHSLGIPRDKDEGKGEGDKKDEEKGKGDD